MKFKNVVKTGATTAVTYAIAGPIPAIANLATSVAVDEVLPEEPEIKDIKTKTQAVALVATSWGMNALYGFIAFLLITNILTPLLTKMTELFDKIKSMKKTTLVVAGVFAIIIIANLLGYGG